MYRFVRVCFVVGVCGGLGLAWLVWRSVGLYLGVGLGFDVGVLFGVSALICL